MQTISDSGQTAVSDQRSAREVVLDSSVPLSCPSCGATLHYSPVSSDLACASCGGHVSIAAWTDALDKEPVEHAIATEDRDWGTDEVVFTCRSCGAKTTCDGNVLSTVCSYCGNNMIATRGPSDLIMPSGVIRFTVSDEDASAQFATWLKHRIFAPSAARRNAKAGRFEGIYLPSFTFDADTSSAFSAQYSEKKTITKEDANGNTTTEEVTEWYPYTGHFDDRIADVLVMATSHQDMNLLDKVEPFQISDAVSYEPAFLAGFDAEKYSIGLDASSSAARESIDSELRSQASSIVSAAHPGSDVNITDLSTDYRSFLFAYLLVPLWISSFAFGGKQYQFVVNGQTGEVAGHAPVSPWRVLALIAIIVGMIALIWYLVFGR